jgi:hypothetical protein
MGKDDQMIEALIGLVNRHFQMQVELGEENVPVVTRAEQKTAHSITQFLNGVIQLVENADAEGTLNYYFDDELDYETSEEHYRY